MSGALSELTCLSLRRPGMDAPAADLAAYIERIAAVHEHLAADCRGVEAATEHRLAAAYHRHDRELRT